MLDSRIVLTHREAERATSRHGPVSHSYSWLRFSRDIISSGLGSPSRCDRCGCRPTDPGPHYLGSGESFTNRDAVKRDLLLMIEAGLDREIPVLIGTAGGAGAEPHLVWLLGDRRRSTL